MKVITLIQPWATLIALSEKSIETRGWKTDYRGPLLIHAGKKVDKCCKFNPFRKVLEMHGYTKEMLPTGVIVAKCNLVDCLKVTRAGVINGELEGGRLVEGNEYKFGGYDKGRYGWILENIEMLKEPISAKGKQRLWNFELKFYQLFKNRMATEDGINDYIEKWHTGDSPEELHEYLGMTEEQYDKWFKNGVL